MGKKYLGPVSDPKDIVTKEYVDGSTGEIKTIISNRGPLPSDVGTPGQRWLDTVHGNVEYTCIAATIGTPNTYTWLYTGGCNENLLDNWYFVGGGSQQGGGQFPINQRGETSYTGARYGIDRWYVAAQQGEVVTIQNDGITIAVPSNSDLFFGQKLDTAAKRAIIGKTITMSVLAANVQDGTKEIGFFIGNDSQSEYLSEYAHISSSGCFSITVTIPNTWVDTDVIRAAIYCGESNSIKLIAVKLELGDRQTLAHQDENGNWVLNEVPDFQQELAKCYRYRIVYSGVEWGRFAIANAWQGGATVLLWLPSPLRATPSVNVSALRFHDGINTIDVNSPNIADPRMHGNVFAFDVYTTQFTNGKFYTVSTLDGAPLVIDANL